jgi:hypothetical protein
MELIEKSSARGGRERERERERENKLPTSLIIIIMHTFFCSISEELKVASDNN